MRKGKDIGFIMVGLIVGLFISAVILTIMPKEKIQEPKNVSIALEKNVQNFILPSKNDIKFHMEQDEATRTRKLIIFVNDTTPITGDSMNPTFFEGNRLIWISYIGQKLHQGQIISFESPSGKSVSHRITAVYSNYVLTSGDNRIRTERVNLTQIKKIIIGVLYT